ncbi:hypothetical protein NQ314_014603 [Rhamnusium bicolor]|uniref:MULE transposase domain-containing protein n=1 Tax=Rhamnusium bicolor TaxID=1586634 RepID=A0AAV8X211_9CUCU|nr:hypothetical protein NQ314_014603 [Rhamnusium bicolor]
MSRATKIVALALQDEQQPAASNSRASDAGSSKLSSIPKLSEHAVSRSVTQTKPLSKDTDKIEDLKDSFYVTSEHLDDDEVMKKIVQPADAYASSEQSDDTEIPEMFEDSGSSYIPSDESDETDERKDKKKKKKTRPHNTDNLICGRKTWRKTTNAVMYLNLNSNIPTDRKFHITIAADQYKRLLKSQASCKMGSCCTSQIKLVKKNDGLTIKWVKTHYGHTTDLQHIRIPKEDRQIVASKLVNGVTLMRILETTRDNIEAHLKKVDLLTSKDIHNIKTSYNIEVSDGRRHANDAISVDLWVEERRSENPEDNPVVYYKKQGESAKNLQKNDFCLIIMNKSQKVMLEEFGSNIIAIDGTHGLNGYDFELTTVMVIDEYKQGFPVVLCFATKKDTLIYSILFEKIKLIVGRIVPNTFMSDLAETFYNAWFQVMGPVENQLFYSWHVDRAWQSNLNKIGNIEKRSQVYKILKILQQETSACNFEISLQNAIEYMLNDKETELFGHYFSNNYSHNYNKWAYCFREKLGINTNMHLKSMHKLIKYFYLARKTVKRLDKGLHVVLKYVRDKSVERIIKITKVANHLDIEQVQETKNSFVSTVANSDQPTKHSKFDSLVLSTFCKLQQLNLEKLSDSIIQQIHYHSYADVYRVYKEHYNQNRISEVCGRWVFTQELREMNIGLFQPKKDQCDLCFAHNLGNNVSDADYQTHILEKDRVRQKLACKNYTIYNVASRHVVCYVWHEGEGGSEANDFASCLLDFLEYEFTDQEKKAILKWNVIASIPQLREGKRTKIFSPANFVQLIEESRQSVPGPYRVKYIHHDFFKDYRGLKFYNSIRPGRKAGDNCANDIRALKYGPEVGIDYKISFSDDWLLLPQRPIQKDNINLLDIPNLYSASLLITRLNKLADTIETLEKNQEENCSKKILKENIANLESGNITKENENNELIPSDPEDPFYTSEGSKYCPSVEEGNCLASGKGNFFKPVRQPDVPNRSLLPCDNCLGFFSCKLLYRHRKKCLGDQYKNGKSHSAGQSKLVINKRVDKRLAQEVFPHMRADKAASRKMRELSKILIGMRKLDPNITDMFSTLQPKYFDLFVQAVKQVSKYDAEKDLYFSPTFAINIATSLKQCCDIAITYAYKKSVPYLTISSGEVEVNLKTLIHLFTSNWRVILLNRKRSGELQRMPLDAYKINTSEKQGYEEFNKVVSSAEQILLKTLKRVVIRGKRGKGVPVLFSSDVQEHINTLLDVNSITHITGYKILSKHTINCGAKNPSSITSTRLRKHLATLSQLFSLSDNEIEQLATFMGHTPDVHRNSYRLPDDVYQTAKISKLLTIMEKGGVNEYRGKTLDEVNIDMEENLLDSKSDEDDADDDIVDVLPEQVPSTSATIPLQKKKRILVPWTSEQKKVARRFFKDHIKYRKPPKREECDELKEKHSDLLQNKDWLKIKVFIQNEYTKKNKL